MAEHLTEEEQIEAIKRWWNDNWLSVVMPIVFAILAYTGWNYWNDHNASEAQAASDKYESLTTLLSEKQGALSDDERQDAIDLASEISKDYSGTLYSNLGAMILAKLQLEAGNVEQAESALRGVLAAPSNDGVESLVQARLAKVLLEQDKYEEALALVGQTDQVSVKALYSEVRGDIYLDQGELAAANTAYQEALDSLTPEQFSHRGLIRFKLDGTRVANSGEVVESKEPVSEPVVEAAEDTQVSDSSDD